MKTYTIYINKNNPESLEEAVFVPEGFSFWAAVFTAFWMLYHRLWLCAAALIVINICFIALENHGIISPEVSSILQLGILVYIGFEANDWHRRSLGRKGYEFSEIIAAKNLEEAKQRFFTNAVGAV